jgi:hypothetical protein
VLQFLGFALIAVSAMATFGCARMRPCRWELPAVTAAAFLGFAGVGAVAAHTSAEFKSCLAAGSAECTSVDRTQATLAAGVMLAK